MLSLRISSVSALLRLEGTLRHPSVISICLLGYHGGVRPTCSSWLLSARVTVSGA